MQCVLVTKAAYRSLSWPVHFSDMVSQSETAGSGFTVVECGGGQEKTAIGSPKTLKSVMKPNGDVEVLGAINATPNGHALFYGHGTNGNAYLVVDNL